MIKNSEHSFHIPVMGTSFTMDSPIKVARYGISSVLSIGDDDLCERLRKYYSKIYNEPFVPIETKEKDFRAKRITAYLNLINDVVLDQIKKIKKDKFEPGKEITRYFELLSEDSKLKKLYNKMLKTKDNTEKKELEEELRSNIVPGSIDVNIMTKVDRDIYDNDGNRQPEGTSDALSALRGFAQSKLTSSIVLSAGFNRRLYAYASMFDDFYPDEKGETKKKIVLKVSDFRSTKIQGKFLAKKGLWVSEYRIESGLNCGGHAFATEGNLIGPIMEEFKNKKETFLAGLYEICNKAIQQMERIVFKKQPDAIITVQGGIGTSKEDTFLKREFSVTSTGWATPFLLVPEAVTVDDYTQDLLVSATKEDLYLSRVSPLNILFNTVRGTKSEALKRDRIAKGSPGSPCPKGHLAIYNTEFTDLPVCTASRRYQKKKIEQIESLEHSKEEKKRLYDDTVEKVCLCEDLSAGTYIKYNINSGRPLNPAICPGPNLAFFNRIYSLAEMVSHIYGKIDLLQDVKRPHMFIQELKMYIDHFSQEIKETFPKLTPKHIQRLNSFKTNLLDGIEYYKQLVPKMIEETKKCQQYFLDDLNTLGSELEKLILENKAVFAV
ncbi:MAG: hypothetical protein GY730_07430 [bacterium]|nr:hypothetical protein [bacterium]